VLHVSGGATTVSDVNAYTLDIATGANHLTISSGHFLDAITFCVSPIAVITGAALATHYPRARSVETGAEVARTTPDSVVVSGILENGGTLAFHSFVGSSAYVGIRFRISGTEGDLLVESSAPRGVQIVPLILRGARAGDGPSPKMPRIGGSERFRWVAASVPDGPPLAVAQMFARLSESIRSGVPSGPDFATALANHQLLDRIRTASERPIGNILPRAQA
jgi:predicted dehydrogenase